MSGVSRRLEPKRSHALALALAARPRLVIASLVGATVGLALPADWIARPVTRWILAWNAGIWLYLLLVGWMVAQAEQGDIERRAARQDEGARTILALVTLSALTSLGAIIAELAVAKDFRGTERYAHVALAAGTLLASWAFTQVMFALHYAQRYYTAVAAGKPGGLLFPGEAAPDYLDFLYFAVVIGTSGQTADVSFTSQGMRRLGLAHCILAFLFNTSLLALMINVASSLL